MPFKVFKEPNYQERIEPPEIEERKKKTYAEEDERSIYEELEIERAREENISSDLIEENKRIALKIKGLIAEKGITQAILAEAIKMSRITLNYKLNGKSVFKYPELLEIAKYFGKPVSYFFLNYILTD
jgi:DNA-binding XRE family transcriptional regulator